MSEVVNFKERREMEAQKPPLPTPEVIVHLERYLAECQLKQEIALPDELLAGGYQRFARLSWNPAKTRFQNSKEKSLLELIDLCRSGGWRTSIGYPMHKLVRRPMESEDPIVIPAPGDIGLFALWPDQKAGAVSFRETVVDILREDFSVFVRDVDPRELEIDHVLLREFPVLSDAQPVPEFYNVMELSTRMRRKYAIAMTISPNGCLVQVWRSRNPVKRLDAVEDDPGADISHDAVP